MENGPVSERKIYHDLAERLRKLSKGIVLSGGKTFYPKKAQSCYKCCFQIYDSIKRAKGCWYFDTQIDRGNQKPIGVCIPVRDDSKVAQAYADRVVLKMEEIIK